MNYLIKPLLRSMCTAWLATGVSNQTLAAIETASSAATLALPAQGASEVVSTGRFSLIAWLKPDIGDSSDCEQSVMNVLHLENGLSLHLLADGSVQGTILGFSSDSHTKMSLSATTVPLIMRGSDPSWVLIGLCFNAEDNILSIWAITEQGHLESAHAIDATFALGEVGLMLTIGAYGPLHAMEGVYGLIALRDHIIDASDVLDLWLHRRHHGPFSFTNASTGGSLTGPDGCVWMTNHAMTTRPISAESGGEPHDWAAIVGKPVTRYNTHIYDTTQEEGASFRVVRPVASTKDFVYRSPYDGNCVGPLFVENVFFVRDAPNIGSTLPTPHFVSRQSPKARFLATKIPPGAGLIRVLVSGNSRALEESDGSATGIGNFSHGFLWNNLHRTAGVLNRPARLNPGLWFGFDGSEHGPHIEGHVNKLVTTDFSRFWTNSHRTLSIGPGEGVRLIEGASYTLRCRPQGLIAHDQPLFVQAHLLRFPGANPVQWTSNKHTRQGGPGIQVSEPTTILLDTQMWSHALDFSAGDQVPSASRIILAGDNSSTLVVGDACYAGDGAISVIANITFDGISTLIDFEHPLSVVPIDGTLLRFGPWGYETINYLWPGLCESDENTWRGLKLAAIEGGDNGGVVLFSFDAWRPNVDGFVFGVAGWRGMGYEQHIKRSFTHVTSAWASQLSVDVWLMTFATQLSHPSWMNTYTEQARTGSGDVEILWLGDVEHPSSWDTELWHWWALTQATANDVAASTVLLHCTLGGQLDLFGDGIRSDVLHLTQRGNQRLAMLWTESLLEAALPGPVASPADLNGDGTVDVSDLLILLTQWGQCDNANDCPADFNSDGTVDVTDLLIMLSQWG